MNLLELKQRLIDNTINIINHDHNVDILERVTNHIDDLNYRIERRLANGNEEAAQYVIDELNEDIIDEPTYIHFRCSSCDNGYLNLKVLDEDTIILEDKNPKNKDLPSVCPAKKLLDNGKLETFININTGKLVLQNFFEKEELYEMPTYNNINDIVGIDNLMQYLASTKNVGYIQLTNTHVGIYQKGDEIIVHSGIWDYEDEDEEEKDYSYLDEYQHLGNISCSVWRIMFADISVLEAHNEEEDKDRIITSLTPGKYAVENSFVIDWNCDGILARIKRYDG
jgi:uncharacterized protein YacL (UPF0231 family)